MTGTFADKLDAKLDELIAEGFEIKKIFATSADIEQLFIDRGESAVLLDCDPGQDRAWYGQYELVPDEGILTMVMYCKGEDCWIGKIASDPTEGLYRAAS